MTPPPRQRRPGRRQARPRQAKGASRVGERFEAVVGNVAHGGHCVVRLDAPESRVVFVRHAIPGERVVLEITEGTEGDRFWRGDAVEVVEASPDRVEAPCVFAGPGRCGGCDFQHVSLTEQRDLKAAVVREQLSRLARIDLTVEVEAVPGDVDGLRWRTRVAYAATPDGRRGMHLHRSRQVIPVDECLIAAPDAQVIGPTAGPAESTEAPIVERVEAAGAVHDFTLAADGFWQVHPGAPRVLVETVLAMLDPQPGERVLDLYSGVGLFARFLADRVGDGTRVVSIEGDRTASGHARDNLGAHRGAVTESGAVERVLATSYDEPFDLVVLDPPRDGARRTVVAQVVDRAPRAIAYVACDPAALARDLATFAELGYRLQELRAFDLYPMTHHVECVALLERTVADLGRRESL